MTEPLPSSRIMSSTVMHWVGRLFFWIGGWKVVGRKPEIAKYVAIAVPHTTNWDGIWFFAAGCILRMEVCFLGKHSLFVGPFGWFLRAMGGIPLDRGRRHNMVRQAVDWLQRADRLCIGIAPEGTRKWTPGWRLGFYHIARQAGVPIVLCYADYAKKEAGVLDEPFWPTGDVEADFARLRAIYEPIVAGRPENRGPIVPLPAAAPAE
ncbi:MAG: lysophospholipid acyltransferase family protein [Vicinamibacteria bacterium]|nr:lysophospholipid acyltransferase family protein [Vicinamibacteria bacterium]